MRFLKCALLAAWTAGVCRVMAGDTAAPVPTGPSVIHNGDFKMVEKVDDADFPKNWVAAQGTVEYLASGGPGGRPAFKLTGEALVRQPGACSLAEGELYRLSLLAKTVKLPRNGGAVIVHNEGWKQTSRLAAFPSDTDWKKFSVDFKAVPTARGRYGIAIQTRGADDCELYVADIRLEPLSAAAADGARALRQ